MHYGTKSGHFEISKIHFPTSEGESEVSKRRGARERREQGRACERVRVASKQAITRSSGPVLTYGFLVILERSGKWKNEAEHADGQKWILRIQKCIDFAIMYDAKQDPVEFGFQL